MCRRCLAPVTFGLTLKQCFEFEQANDTGKEIRNLDQENDIA